MKVPNPKQNILFGAPDLQLKIYSGFLTGFILKNKTYVILLKDFQKMLGYDGKSEDWLLELLKSISRFNSVAHSYLEKLENPPIATYQNSSGTEIKLRTIHVETVFAVLEAIIKAKNDGHLNVNQLRHAKASEKLHEILKKNSLYTLINESTGFSFYKKRAKSKLQKYLTDKSEDAAMKWVVTFPDDFYEELFNLFDYDWIKFHQNTESFAKIANDVIFSRIPTNLLDALRSTNPKRGYSTTNGQDLQHSDLKVFTTELLDLIEKSAGNKNIFLQLLARIYPKNVSWKLKDSTFSENSQTNQVLLSEFNATLQKGIFLNKNFVSKKKKT